MNDGIMRSIRADGLNADFFCGTGDTPQEALVLLGGSEGGKSWNEHPAFIQQIVGLGYAVLSLAYFGAEGLPPNLRAIPLEYFTAAFRWLASQKEVIPGRYTLMGVSRGAELALLLGSQLPQVKAIVAIAPSSVLFPGPPLGLWDAFRGQHSAWSQAGHETACVPIPYTLTSLRGMLTGQRAKMFEAALRNAPAVGAAAIPAEKVRGPILLISFTQDQIWPSTAMANQLIDRLRRNGFAHPYDHQAYATTHSNWSIEPCRTNILAFLKECRAG